MGTAEQARHDVGRAVYGAGRQPSDAMLFVLHSQCCAMCGALLAAQSRMKGGNSCNK
jgi:hypothetical protein